MKAEPSTTQSEKITDDLIYGLSRHFEQHMNDDLDVKGAFDAIFDTVSKLINLMNEGRINRKSHRRIIECIRKADEVLQVIF